VRTAAPRVAFGTAPEWLIVGAVLDLAAPRSDRQDWSRTSLSEEAGGQITRTDILQSLAAHFLALLHTWQEEGFRQVHDQWLFRAEGREAPITIVHGGKSIQGRVLGLDESANLLIKTMDGRVQSLAYTECVDLIGREAP
jgi:biotin-(acetyl-CoA carboxylase) ligase